MSYCFVLRSMFCFLKVPVCDDICKELRYMEELLAKSKGTDSILFSLHHLGWDYI